MPPVEFSNERRARPGIRWTPVAGVLLTALLAYCWFVSASDPERPGAWVLLVPAIFASLCWWRLRQVRAWSYLVTAEEVVVRRNGSEDERIRWADVAAVSEMAPALITWKGRRLPLHLLNWFTGPSAILRETFQSYLRSNPPQEPIEIIAVDWPTTRLAAAGLMSFGLILSAVFYFLGQATNSQAQWWVIVTPTAGFFLLLILLLWPSHGRAYLFTRKGITLRRHGRDLEHLPWEDVTSFVSHRLMLNTRSGRRIRVWSAGGKEIIQTALHLSPHPVPVVRPSKNVEIKPGTLCWLSVMPLAFVAAFLLAAYFGRKQWLEFLGSLASFVLLSSPVFAYMAVRLQMERRISWALILAALLSFGTMGLAGLLVCWR